MCVLPMSSNNLNELLELFLVAIRTITLTELSWREYLRIRIGRRPARRWVFIQF